MSYKDFLRKRFKRFIIYEGEDWFLLNVRRIHDLMHDSQIQQDRITMLNYRKELNNNLTYNAWCFGRRVSKTGYMKNKYHGLILYKTKIENRYFSWLCLSSFDISYEAMLNEKIGQPIGREQNNQRFKLVYTNFCYIPPEYKII